METIKIKVIGVGGAGSNTIDRLSRSKIKGVDLVSINTDVQDLKKKNAHIKLRIGEKTTKGLGSGMKPEVGKASAKESYKDIEELIKGGDIIFLTAGLGGGTGSGVTPVVSEITKKKGVLTIGIFTLPFSFEGKKRKKIALNSLEEVKKKIDTLVVIPNDKLISSKLSVEDAFLKCDDFLREAVESISNIIVNTGIINLDFSDIKEILKNGGIAFFGIGRAQGKERALKALEKALYSPVAKASLEKSSGILFDVASNGQGASLSEIKKIAETLKKKSPLNNKIIFGSSIDENLLKDEIRVTIIATGSEKP